MLRLPVEQNAPRAPEKRKGPDEPGLCALLAG